MVTVAAPLARLVGRAGVRLRIGTTRAPVEPLVMVRLKPVPRIATLTLKEIHLVASSLLRLTTSWSVPSE
jgi:hypothetical protein